MKRDSQAVQRPSYNIVSNIDAFLKQLVNLGSNGYYFYYHQQVKAKKTADAYDQTLIEKWELDKPYWMREARRRGMAPSIWMLRFERNCLLLSTKGRDVTSGREGEPHDFFVRYGSHMRDIRKQSLYFCGFAIRFPRCHETGKWKAQVKLDQTTYEHLKEMMLKKATSERYRTQEAIEREFSNIPWQRYGHVCEQIRRILDEANRRRQRYQGYPPARVTKIRWKMRTARIYDYDSEERSAA